MFSWLEILLLLIVVLASTILLTRLIIIPRWKREKILKTQLYCPSLMLPPLPDKLNHTIEILSRKIDGRTYQVNLYQQRCSCRRFRKHRGFYPHGDIRRLCRHLRREFEVHGEGLGLDPLLQCIIDRKVKDSCYHKFNVLNTPVAIGFHPTSDFFRVYSRQRSPSDPEEGPLTGPYEKFTLVLAQENWVYGTPPPNAEEIIEIANKTAKGFRAVYPHKEKLAGFRR